MFLRILQGVLVLALSAGTGCSPGAPLPAPSPTLGITMREYAFEGMPARVAPGRVVFRARNSGKLNHEVVVLPLPRNLREGLAEAVRSKRHRAATVLALLAPRPPGRVITFASEFSPGSYGIVCFVRDADGKTHAVKGMTAEFQVARKSQ